MKITDMHLYVVPVEAKHVGALKWVFVRLDTDEGISGWGEAGARRVRTTGAVYAGLESLRDEVIGYDPADIEDMWQRIYHRFTYFGSRGFATSLAAGIDIALWDIKGKATGRPVYDLLGGRYRETVPMYTNVWFDDTCTTPEAYAEAARTYVTGLGHAACKLDPFREMRQYHHRYHKGQISAAGENQGYDIVSAVREAVGPEIDILIDAHGHYDVPTAIRLANTLYERSRIGWFEEPVAPESHAALQTVRAHTAAPICVGERLYTRYDFLPVFEQRLADYIMPDTVWTGGISEVKKIAIQAEPYNVPIAPHVVPGGPIGLLAAAHAMMTVPNFYRLEHSHHNIVDHHAMLTEPYRIEEGHMILNGKPGLGYDLDQEWLDAHAE